MHLPMDFTSFQNFLIYHRYFLLHNTVSFFSVSALYQFSALFGIQEGINILQEWRQEWTTNHRNDWRQHCSCSSHGRDRFTVNIKVLWGRVRHLVFQMYLPSYTVSCLFTRKVCGWWVFLNPTEVREERGLDWCCGILVDIRMMILTVPHIIVNSEMQLFQCDLETKLRKLFGSSLTTLHP
jgi:hypothetical protein